MTKNFPDSLNIQPPLIVQKKDEKKTQNNTVDFVKPFDPQQDIGNTYFVNEDFEEQKKVLETQISSVEIRQQNIQNMISTIETQLQQIQTMISHEKDKQKRANLYKTYNYSSNLLVSFLDLYNSYEVTKQRYYKQISDLLVSKNKLIHVEINRINAKLDNLNSTADELVAFFGKLSSLMDGNNLPKELQEKIQIDDPDCEI